MEDRSPLETADGPKTQGVIPIVRVGGGAIELPYGETKLLWILVKNEFDELKELSVSHVNPTSVEHVHFDLKQKVAPGLSVALIPLTRGTGSNPPASASIKVEGTKGVPITVEISLVPILLSADALKVVQDPITQGVIPIVAKPEELHLRRGESGQVEVEYKLAVPGQSGYGSAGSASLATASVTPQQVIVSAASLTKTFEIRGRAVGQTTITFYSDDGKHKSVRVIVS